MRGIVFWRLGSLRVVVGVRGAGVGWGCVSDGPVRGAAMRAAS